MHVTRQSFFNKRKRGKKRRLQELEILLNFAAKGSRSRILEGHSTGFTARSMLRVRDTHSSCQFLVYDFERLGILLLLTAKIMLIHIFLQWAFNRCFPRTKCLAVLDPFFITLLTLCLETRQSNQVSDTCRGIGIDLFQLVGQCGSVLDCRLYSKLQGLCFVKGTPSVPHQTRFVTFWRYSFRILLICENEKLDQNMEV